MAKVVGIRFKQAGKIYHFSPGDIETKLGDHVIVETSRGIEYGTIVVAEHEEENKNLSQPLKEVLRIATEEDTEHEKENKKKEMEAFVICLDKIREHGLEMKLIDCEITFDNSKILFYFTADGRIDFRELVKDLASIFHIRIELRQEGVRDETKTLGGLGSCGRELCCHSYLTDFVPVSIKMAKNQSLSLNTSKISGVCGRLMCCLKYEENVYEELNRTLPSVGDTAFTPDGLKGVVSAVGTLKQRVKVLVELPNDEKEIREYAAGELKVVSRKKGMQRGVYAYDDADEQDINEELIMETGVDDSGDLSMDGEHDEAGFGMEGTGDGRQEDIRRRVSDQSENDERSRKRPFRGRRKERPGSRHGQSQEGRNSQNGSDHENRREGCGEDRPRRRHRSREKTDRKS